MAERDQTPIAPARSLGGATTEAPLAASLASKFRRPERPAQAAPGSRAGGLDDGGRVVRQAKLRLVQIEPWSVMKAAFLLSVAVGIVTVVAVGIVWGVLGAAGLWDSVNSIVRDSIGTTSGTPFQIQNYLGTSRVIGFTMIVAVADVVLITAIATLAAFLYNLAATLVGGVEVTFAEDR
ncbi:MAG: hypothetical protein JWR52_1835 [Marmoricola sp.]|nr:hypothetical protein [Marmoricola sp.]